MAGKSVSFYQHCNLSESQLETLAKWLSCNGEIWGVGPTAVFASAAALFLYNELEATLFVPGDQNSVSMMEKSLITTMMLGMLALMIHLWVCSMRFFQYYLDTLIRDSPNVFLEMTTAGILGQEIVPLGPLTRFLRQQQPQIHITFCWFLSLCYADYVRKNYCQRFNMPYLEQWQAEVHERVYRAVRHTMERVNSFVGAIHQRLRGYTARDPQQPMHDANTVEALCRSRLLWRSTALLARYLGETSGAGEGVSRVSARTITSCACAWSASRAKLLLMRLRSSELLSRPTGVHVALRRTPGSIILRSSYPQPRRSLENFPSRGINNFPFE